jgi:hypothetical protein
VNSRRLAGAVPVAFACGAAACVLLLRHAPGNAAPDLRQPLAVAAGWRGFGVAYWAIAAAVWCASAWAVDRIGSRPGAPPTVTTIAIASGSALAAALLWPAVASSDVYAYASFGERAASGASPYGVLTAQPADAIDRAALWQWGSRLPPDNYGPLFNTIAAAIVIASRGDAGLACLLFRLAACIAFAGCSALLWLVYERDRAAGVCVFALNPLVVWSAAEGHNDFYAGILVLGGLLAARRFPIGGGALAALGTLVKLPALAAVSVAAAVAPARRDWLTGAAIGAAAALAACAPLFEAAIARAGRPPLWPSTPVLYPWYAVWLIPFLAAVPGARRATLVASALAVVAYLPDVWGSGAPGARVAVSVAAGAGWLGAVAVALAAQRSGGSRTSRAAASRA